MKLRKQTIANLNIRVNRSNYTDYCQENETWYSYCDNCPDDGDTINFGDH